jgi:Ca2+-binding EF-hand superfamily protein
MSVSSITPNSQNAADFAASRKKQFQAIDTNSDGKLDSDELSTMLKNAPKPPGASATKAPDAKEMIKKLDTDGDGKLTEAELDAGFEKDGANRPPNADGTGRVINTKS